MRISHVEMHPKDLLESTPESTRIPKDLPQSTRMPGDLPESTRNPGDLQESTQIPGDLLPHLLFVYFQIL